MNNAYIKEVLTSMSQGANKRYAEQWKAEKHRRNVAALVDFTSNLISVLGNSGVTSIFSPSRKHNGSFSRYNSSLRDYKGVIAGNMFRTRFAPGTGWGNSIDSKHFKI